MTQYRYQLERYRGRSTRHVCPQCGRKNVFTRYIDTENNNIYISDIVGKCNRLDKCGYHYTPHQYFTDNPWKRDNSLREEKGFPSIQFHRENGWMDNTPPPTGYIPEWVWEHSRTVKVVADHVRWLASKFGVEETQRVYDLYEMGMTEDKRVIFWQIDYDGQIRTGKVMAYDPITGKRQKHEGAITWVHSDLKRAGVLAEDWHLEQCLYGEHLLKCNPSYTVAVVEAYKTAHVGAILYPEYLWVAVDSMMGLTAERLRHLKGREVILFPDEGKGYEVWSQRIAKIAEEVGFNYRMSTFMEGRERGGDIADLISNEE